jgi:hypothetical protein
MRNSTAEAHNGIGLNALSDKDRGFFYGFRSVQEKVCRILVNRDLNVVYRDMDAPAYTDTTDIFIGLQPAHAKLQSMGMKKRFVLGLNALVKHELAHVMYTPNMSFSHDHDHPLCGVITISKTAWNVLEDQRVETLFTKRYPATVPHFIILTAEWIIASKKSTTTLGSIFPLIYGRRFLDPALIAECEADLIKTAKEHYLKHGLDEKTAFKDFGGSIESAVEKLKAVIDEYIAFRYPAKRDLSNTEVAERCVRDFDSLTYLLLTASSSGTSQPTEPERRADGETRSKNGESAKSRTDKSLERAEQAQKEADQKTDEQKDSDDTDDDSNEDGANGAESNEKGGDKGAETDGSNGESADGAADKQGAGKPADSSNEPSTAGKGDSGTVIDPKKVAQKMLDEAMKDGAITQEYKSTVETINTITASGEHLRMDALTADGNSSITIPIAPEFKRAAADIATIVRTLHNELAPEWQNRNRSGRFDMRRYLRDESANRAPIDVYRRWYEGNEQDATIDVMILVDASSSMRAVIGDVSLTMWAIKTGLMIPGVNVGIISYSEGGSQWPKVISRQREKFTGDIVSVPAVGGSTYVEPALKSAYGHYSYTKAKNPVVIILTDGQWSDTIESETYVKKLNALGVITVLTGLKDAVRNYGNHQCKIAVDVKHPRELAPIIRNVVTNLMRKSLVSR